MTERVPVTNPMAALRAIRRASWGGTALADIPTHRATLAPALVELSVTWMALCDAHDLYMARPTTDRWSNLCDAFGEFDAACAIFFGPSGAETRDRPQVFPGEPARRQET